MPAAVKVLTTLVMAPLTGVVSGVGVRLKTPSIRPNRIPERLLPHMLVEQSMPTEDGGINAVTLSSGSYPTLIMTVRIFAMLATERPIAPTVSCVKDIGTTPVHDVSPLFGRKLNSCLRLRGFEAN